MKISNWPDKSLFPQGGGWSCSIRGLALLLVLAASHLVLGAGAGSELDPYRLQAEDYVELEAQVQVSQWGQSHPDRSYQAHMVVGRDTWMMELNDSTRIRAWFTGTNLVVERVFEPSGQAGLDVGRPTLQIEPSQDGNPTRPPRVIDLLNLPERIAWIACCSGPCVNRGLSEIHPPNEFWKQYLNAGSLTRKVTPFQDDLGLPERFLIFANESQPVLDYRVISSTNVLDWNFPAEFAIAQYRPTGTKGWMLDFLAQGHLISVGPGRRPSLQVPGWDQVAKANVSKAEAGVHYELADGSSVRIGGTSDVHDWELQSSRVYGYLQLREGEPFEARGAVVVPVRHLSTGFGGPMFGGKKDSALVHQLLKTARYPNIECELRDIHFGRGTEPAAGEQRACKLTVLINAGGVSREIEMPGEITREKAGLLRLSGSMPLRMSDFGLIPPSVPDIVKVGDALKVSFEFLFNPR